jgi:competence protein ComFB
VPDYQVMNIVEKIVQEGVNEILPGLDNVCRCDKCRADIAAMALNQIAPRYVVNRTAEIISHGEFETPQWRAEILTAILRASRKIALHPHLERPFKP